MGFITMVVNKVSFCITHLSDLFVLYLLNTCCIPCNENVLDEFIILAHYSSCTESARTLLYLKNLNFFVMILNCYLAVHQINKYRWRQQYWLIDFEKSSNWREILSVLRMHFQWPSWCSQLELYLNNKLT